MKISTKIFFLILDVYGVLGALFLLWQTHQLISSSSAQGATLNLYFFPVLLGILQIFKIFKILQIALRKRNSWFEAHKEFEKDVQLKQQAYEQQEIPLKQPAKWQSYVLILFFFFLPLVFIFVDIGPTGHPAGLEMRLALIGIMSLPLVFIIFQYFKIQSRAKRERQSFWQMMALMEREQKIQVRQGDLKEMKNPRHLLKISIGMAVLASLALTSVFGFVKLPFPSFEILGLCCGYLSIYLALMSATNIFKK